MVDLVITGGSGWSGGTVVLVQKLTCDHAYDYKCIGLQGIHIFTPTLYLMQRGQMAI